MDKPEIENLESLVKTTTALQRTRKETTEREREREREKSHRFLLLQHLLRHGYTIAHFPLFLCKLKVPVLVLVLFLVVLLLLFTRQPISHPQNSR
jgi:hypothetical protein